MRRNARGRLGGVVLAGLLAAALPAARADLEDFTLTRAVPADVLLAVHARSHDGMQFLKAQYARVFAAVERQGFDKELRRLLRSAIREQGGDLEAFDQRWKQFTDLAAGVEWSGLSERELAFAMRVEAPFGGDLVLLLMPAADRVARDFEGLSAILKSLVGLAPEGTLVLNTDGEGDAIIHKLALADPNVPLKLTLARQGDVLVLGIGSSLAEQSLALLRGAAPGPGQTLASTARFRAAFQKLPPPQDSLFYLDVDRLMAQCRTLAKLLADHLGPLAASAPAADAPPPAEPFAWLPRLVEALDVWETVAVVESTSGMQTRSEQLTVLRAEAETRPLYRVLYGRGPVRDPLRYVPKEATDVSVTSGLDFRALYQEILAFVEREVPGGADLLTGWKESQARMELDVDADVLSWLGSSLTTFSAPIPTPFLPGWVWIVEVRDEEKARAALERLAGWLDTLLVAQRGLVEDAEMEGAAGFKRIILPPMIAMLAAPLGKPMFGVTDGRLFIANGPEILGLALKAGRGEGETFARNERFAAEGLPLPSEVVAFSFSDLSKLGESLGQALPAAAFAARMAQPDAAKNPVMSSVLNVLSKIGTVCKELNFYRSACSVTTREGREVHTRSVTNYQEPPKPPAPATVPAVSPDEPADKPGPEE